MNEYLPPWLMTVLWASLAGTIFAAMTAILRGVLGPRLPARWLCALWLLALLRFVPWPAVESRYSLWPQVHQSTAVQVPAAIVPAPTPVVRADRLAPASSAAAISLPTRAVPRIAAAVTVSASTPLWSRFLLPAIYLVGVALLLMRFALATRALRALLARAQPAGPSAQRTLDDACAALGISRPVRFMLAHGLSGPAIVGVRRPWLVMAPETLAGLSHEELRHVCLHECAHVRRYDVALNYFMAAIAAVHWFNPAVWLMMSQLRAARELACDERALAHIPDRHAYGRTLLKLFEASNALGISPAVGMVESRTPLHARIRAIAAGRACHRWTARLACLLLAIVASITLTKPLSAAPASAPAKPAEADPFIEKDASGKSHFVPYVDVGERLYKQMGCSRCHSVDAALTVGTGPPWRTLYGRDHVFSSVAATSVAAAGLKASDPEAKWDDYLRESMIDPDAALVRYNVKNFHGMPTFAAQLSGSDTNVEKQRALATYIKSLGTKAYAQDINPAMNPDLFDADHPALFGDNKQPVHPESLAGIKARSAKGRSATGAAVSVPPDETLTTAKGIDATIATFRDDAGAGNSFVPPLKVPLALPAAASTAPAEDVILRNLEEQELQLQQDFAVEESKPAPKLALVTELKSRMNVVKDQENSRRQWLDERSQTTKAALVTMAYDIRSVIGVPLNQTAPITADQRAAAEDLVTTLRQLAAPSETYAAVNGQLIVAATSEGQNRVQQVLASLRQQQKEMHAGR